MIVLDNIKYIDNEIQNGIEVDWKLARKEYKKLNCPKDRFNPTFCPLESVKYLHILSDRSRGKTTNVVLLGLILNKLYGITVVYVRTISEMLRPKDSGTLCDVIINYGYVEKLTDGQYNTMLYKGGKWCYALVDEEMNIQKRSDTVIQCVSVDRATIYKSSLNLPFGDFIIFDEYLEPVYRKDLFVQWCDLLKTVIRDRKSGIVFMLANSIDIESPMFAEYEIYEEVHKMKMGEGKKITSKGGTKQYVELLKKDVSQKRQDINRLYFGFRNPRLSAITGTGWLTDNYPHLPTDIKGSTQIIKNLYIEYMDNYVKMDVYVSESMGEYVYFHKVTKIYDDSIIFTTEPIVDNQHIYKTGDNKLYNYVWGLKDKGKFFYQNNTIGSWVSSYLAMCK